MKIRVPSYYKEFKCIASACEDTCCAGWDVVIDAKTYQAYENMEGAFGVRLRSRMVVDEDGDNIFILDGDRCPFLNNHNLCDIHGELGEQHLCYTCKQYPRYMEEFGDLREIGISLSCPEAARIILGNDKPNEYELSEESQDDDKVDGENVTIDEDEDEANEDALILECFFQCRADILHILEMTDVSLGMRAAIVLRFVEELQDKLDFGEFDAINQVKEKYNDNSYLKELMKELLTYKGNEVIKHNEVYGYFKTYRDLEHINGKDPLGLKKVLRTYWKSEENRALYLEAYKAFEGYYKDEMVNFEKILEYFVYRYFMKSFYDYDMSSKIKVAIVSMIMIKELAVVRWIEKGDFSDEDMVDISHSYSKDIEHLEKNIESLEKTFETEEIYDVDKIINTLMN